MADAKKWANQNLYKDKMKSNSNTNLIFVILGGDYYKENTGIGFYFSIGFIFNAHLLFCRTN